MTVGVYVSSINGNSVHFFLLLMAIWTNIRIPRHIIKPGS